MKTVLVVIDSRDEVNVISTYLKLAGFKVLSANSPEAARLENLPSQANAILVDERLPGTNGFGFCRELTTAPETASIPVVIYSSKNIEANKIYSKVCGACDYLVKSNDPTQIVNVMKQLTSE